MSGSAPSTPVLIASYPRSGNTMLRTVLYHCFGLPSGSVYPDDLGGNKRLERYVGHIEHQSGGQLAFPKGAIPLVKTHHPPAGAANPAIYVMRDGRAATASLWQFYSGNMPLQQIIKGKTPWGTWSDHLSQWRPWQRPQTLLIRYEDLTGNLAGVVDGLAAFLRREPVATAIPKRESIAEVDGRWVKPPSRWQDILPMDMLELFYRYNRPMMEKMGYLEGGE
ncbi:MAG TPA: sulfotransferase domain-containing protein [Xanthobacteraceae bacterium]|nr:sulfotransferase domain-containing protein [Xanthobacteraceae bacterium]